MEYQKRRPKALSSAGFQQIVVDAQGPFESITARQNEINFVKTVQEIEEVAKDITNSLQSTKRIYCDSSRNSRNHGKPSLINEFFPRAFIFTLLP